MVEDEVVELFVAEAAPGLRLALDPAEVMDTRWIGIAELRSEIATRPEAFTPWLRIYLAEHSERLFGGAD
jgi:isopentenyl-diphosphate delta-isomerase